MSSLNDIRAAQKLANSKKMALAFGSSAADKKVSAKAKAVHADCEECGRAAEIQAAEVKKDIVATDVDKVQKQKDIGVVAAGEAQNQNGVVVVVGPVEAEKQTGVFAVKSLEAQEWKGNGAIEAQKGKVAVALGPVEVEKPTGAGRALLSGIYAGLKSAKRKRSDDSEPVLSRQNTAKGLESNTKKDSATNTKADTKTQPGSKQLNTLKSSTHAKVTIDKKTATMASSRGVTRNGRPSRDQFAKLTYINRLVEKCRVANYKGEDLEPHFVLIRQCLHEMECFDFLTLTMLDRSHILAAEYGVGFINQAQEHYFPWDIKVDAEELYKRWTETDDLNLDFLRHIMIKKVASNGGHHNSYKSVGINGGAKDCVVFGSNGIPNGAWWPMQIIAHVNGAHGETEAGIHGKAKLGTYSILLSNGGYEDVDEGNTIYYCGTKSPNAEKHTAATERLMESFASHNPIRVLRSSKMSKAKSIYRPAQGIRYDGLYQIHSFQMIDPKHSHYRFRLDRCGGQTPIRYQGVEIRPTEEQLVQYDKFRSLVGYAH